ncbi:MAG: 50S ribosomal protein L9 [Merdibacter sp.]
MKVILLSDVKNVGKKDEVVEVADGYARNFLIKRKLAVAQTQGSMQVLGRQQEEARLREEELEKEAQKTKERLEKIVLECQIKTGNGGRSFGSISTKQIAEQLAKEHDIHIDRRKILGHDSISSLGDSDLKVDLYRNKVIGVIPVPVSAK